jgi:hypothetical protein
MSSSKDKFDKDKNKQSEEKLIIDMLKEHYAPDDGDILDFDKFYNSIEEKLGQDKASSKIANKNSELEKEYITREEKLHKMLKDVEDQKLKISQKANQTKKKQIQEKKLNKSRFGFKNDQSIIRVFYKFFEFFKLRKAQLIRQKI